jgi:hypothetical protein
MTARDNPVGGSFDEYLTTRLPDQDLENIKLDWGDLQTAGMLDVIPTGHMVTPPHERFTQSVRTFGWQFAKFIEAIPDTTE